VREPPRHRGRGPRSLFLNDAEVAAILLLLAVELRPHRVRAVSARGEEADEDLLAQRRRPSGTSGQPGAQRPPPPRGEAEEPPRPCAARFVVTHDEALALEVSEELVDLADVRMPEGTELGGEALHQLVAVRLSFGEEREQCIAERHGRPPGRRACEP